MSAPKPRLRGLCTRMGIGSPQTLGIEPTVCAQRAQSRRDSSQSVSLAVETRTACGAAGRTTPPGRHACPRKLCSRDRRRRAPERPHARPTGMNEAKRRQPRVRTVGLEKPAPRPIRRRRFGRSPMHHVTGVTPARQRAAKQGLLNPFTRRYCAVRIGVPGPADSPARRSRFSSPRSSASLEDRMAPRHAAALIHSAHSADHPSRAVCSAFFAPV